MYTLEDALAQSSTSNNHNQPSSEWPEASFTPSPSTILPTAPPATASSSSSPSLSTQDASLLVLERRMVAAIASLFREFQANVDSSMATMREEITTNMMQQVNTSHNIQMQGINAILDELRDSTYSDYEEPDRGNILSRVEGETMAERMSGVVETAKTAHVYGHLSPVVPLKAPTTSALGLDCAPEPIVYPSPFITAYTPESFYPVYDTGPSPMTFDPSASIAPSSTFVTTSITTDSLHQHFNSSNPNPHFDHTAIAEDRKPVISPKTAYSRLSSELSSAPSLSPPPSARPALPKSSMTGKKRLHTGSSRRKKSSAAPKTEYMGDDAGLSASGSRKRQKRTKRVPAYWPQIAVYDQGEKPGHIQCEVCTSWYHTCCVGMFLDDPRLATDAEGLYQCPHCEHHRQIYGDCAPRRSRRMNDAGCARPDCKLRLKATGDIEYVIERIIARRSTSSGTVEYLLKWEGYVLIESTWTPASEVGGLQVLLKDFETALTHEGKSTKQIDVLLNEATSIVSPALSGT